jgi:hypothetical protein
MFNETVQQQPVAVDMIKDLVDLQWVVEGLQTLVELVLIVVCEF